MELIERLVAGSGSAMVRCSHTPLDPAKRSVVIALPFGVPASIAHAAVDALAPSCNVVTWESRYILHLEQAFSGEEPMTPSEHVEDLRGVLRALDLRTCCLVGYCSGAGISLLAAARYPDVITELVLVSGEYQLFKRGYPATDYQRTIDTFLPVVATGRPQAGFVFSKMAEISRAARGGPPSELEEQIHRPFGTEESLFRYARNYMAYRDFDALMVAREVRQRTLVVAARQDVHCRAETSLAVGDVISGASSFVDDQGDHYELCRAGSRVLGAIAVQLAVT